MNNMIQRVLQCFGRCTFRSHSEEHESSDDKSKNKYVANEDLVAVKREIGLLSAVTIILCTIIGAGIFVTPKEILRTTGSVGMSLLVWILSGCFCIIGSLCYVELGTAIPKSGCDYHYIMESFGDLPAFLFMWAYLVALTPVSLAVTSLTFSSYVLQSFYWHCAVPTASLRLTAALPICLLTYINCLKVNCAIRLRNMFTAAKVLALIIIIIVGIHHLILGSNQNFHNPFNRTTTEPGYIAVSFYSGFYSYSGWNALNFVTEELKDPMKDLPRAIYISLPLITVIYVLTNVAYFVVLTPQQILTSDAVAVTFGDEVLGVMSWIMPFSVALSNFGGMNGSIFTIARLFFAGAKEGHLPEIISMVNINYYTPIPSLIFRCILALAYLNITEVYALINYKAYIETLFSMVSVAGLLWLRYKRPDMERPIKVSILFPVSFFILCFLLVTFPLYVSPWETGMGLAITLVGIPVYMITVYWKDKPKFYKIAIGKLTSILQKILLCIPEEKHE